MILTKNKHSKKTLVGSVLFGTMVSVVICLGLSAIVAFLVSNGRLGERAMDYLAIAIVLIASFAGCTTAGKGVNNKIAICCITTAAVYTIFLLSLTIFVFDTGFGNVTLPIVVIALSSIAACFVSAGKGSRRKKTSR